jgi:hypothetical protein
VQSQALPKFDDLHLFTGFCAPFRLYGMAKTMLSGVVELIPDRAWLTADAFIDVKGSRRHPKAKQEGKTMSKGKVLVTGSNATRIEVQGSGWGPTGN